MIVKCNLIKINTYAPRASIDDCIWRCDMAFEFEEITIRMMVTNPHSIISLMKEWFGFHARKGYKLISCFRMEWPLHKMNVSI
jgi:hypothetical protein